jgi:hypothetical protein
MFNWNRFDGRWQSAGDESRAIIGAGMIARTHMLACVAARHKMRLKGLRTSAPGEPQAWLWKQARFPDRRCFDISPSHGLES